MVPKKKRVVWVWLCCCCSNGRGMSLLIDKLLPCNCCCITYHRQSCRHPTTAPVAWDLDQCKTKLAPAITQILDDDSESEAALGKNPQDPVDKKHLKPRGKYRAICKLFVTFEGALFPTEATGWCLIENGIVATAGHCVYHKVHGRAIAIEAHISYHGADSELRKTHEVRMAADVAVHRGWHGNFSRENDIALIRLSNPFDDVLPLKWKPCPIQGERMQIVIAGYPGDIPAGRPGQYMYESKGMIDWDLQQDPTLIYRLDTSPGNSGSPVFHVGEDQELVVIGVHVCTEAIERPVNELRSDRAGPFIQVNKAIAIGHKGNNFDNLRQYLMSPNKDFGTRGSNSFKV
ncbi:trypsin-like serine protease [Hyaloscypha bicolor E]|uniref:Trypsin-like serine protease n=1 Tax=Hyaloscypha bicolor E TaxID=1095630 RepID=A0A2J6SJ69_9HELO|nr:trypsin-like serine protease [Hyaloscypha bicolor E]PMD50822.1 trypsin-like serine protease [Hyaloscypha bicolor E]